ncbi:MAG: isoprenylcysteine carboxylmethyltransferase family protein [Reyranella sp.]|uniref:isoprenylcysteine carboxyl methyltransferase family protein n=1 Tax=Reyranella sp. TaxID=1929291 RepID=UPI00272FEEDC|nr:isoprenylcysteine carboxylmethyltransferase family protein [Reyranella sp.]MDP1962198.1 isoprenylcysteine carboxylmethyltransferase family protein [Reyranella sp.]MDP2375735.1 isoprenylcysteine carboxylmethyltransferase family protein [Reyranella sp.]
MTLTVLVLAFVTLQRLGELVIARRNTARLLENGAIEVAPDHYKLIVGLHTLWLAGLWYLALTRGLMPDLLLLAVFVVLQVLRVWVLATLGPRWTTRIIVVPGEQLVTRGPYRYLSHPNYWIVIGEILVLPLVFGLLWFGVVFSILNLVVLWVRIRAENKALGR